MGLLKRLHLKGLRIQKKLRQLGRRPGEYERLVMILGCQKSGATTLLTMFEYDHRTEIFGEDSVLTGEEAERLRLRPIPEVLEILKDVKAPLVLIEPKVESHRAIELLDALPRSRIIWILRDYRSWLEAHLQRFSSQNRYLKILLERSGDWRAEGTSEQVRSLVREFYTPDLSRENCAAIIWYARNVLFFEQGLDRDERVTIVRYESLVQDPTGTLNRVYRVLGLEPAPVAAAKVVRGRTIGMPNEIELNPTINGHCAALQEKFDRLR